MSLKPPIGPNVAVTTDSIIDRFSHLPINVMDTISGYTDVEGDGTTNDSVAIQQRLDLAASTGRAVYFPGRTYLAGNLLVSSNTTIYGDGYATIVRAPASLAAASNSLSSGANLYELHRYIFVNKLGGSTGNSGITIRDLTLDGNVSNGNATTEQYYGIGLYSVQDVSVRDVKVQNNRGDGVSVKWNGTVESSDFHIRDIILENVGIDAGAGSARQGVSVTQGRRFTVRDVTADTVGAFVVDIEPNSNTHICEGFTIDGIHAYNAPACVGLIGHSTGNVRRYRVGATTLRDGPDFSPSYVVLLQGADAGTVDRPETDATTVTYLVHCDTTVPPTNFNIRGVGEVCRVARSSNQTITTATSTAIEWNLEREDRDGMHDPTDATTRTLLTAKAAGTYQVTVSLQWSATTGTFREVSLQKNGTTTVGLDKPSPRTNMTVAFPAVDLAQGDTLKVLVRHDAGVNVDLVLNANYSPECSMVKVG